MRRSVVLSVVLLCNGSAALAHPGHGEASVASEGIWHALVSPVHFLPPLLACFFTAGTALLLRRRLRENAAGRLRR